MSSALLELRGSQVPSVQTTPAYHTTIGPQVVDLAALAGLYLDPWQQLVIEHMFGRRADGSLSSSELAVIVARQNGKGAIIEAAALAWLFLTDERLIIYSAHETKTSDEMFLRLKELIDGAPKLSRRCKPPREANGQQMILTRAGQRMRFLARSKKSGRGFSAPRLLLDEAMFLDERHTAAMGPTLLAMKDPQVGYFSSAPRAEDLVLNALCDRGEAGTSPRLSYFMWAAAKGRKWDDREGWAEALPALGHRLTEEKVLEQLGILGSEEAFMREILSHREDPSAGGAIPMLTWAERVDNDSQIVDRPVFGIETTLDRDRSSIGVAGGRKDHLRHVELIDNLPGTGWVIQRALELQSRWKPKGFVIDPGGPAGSLIVDLEAAGVTLMKVTARDLAQACGGFHDDVVNNRLRFVEDPDGRLNAAAMHAKTRSLSDAWAFDRAAEGDPSPLLAVSLARYGYIGAVQPPSVYEERGMVVL